MFLSPVTYTPKKFHVVIVHIVVTRNSLALKQWGLLFWWKDLILQIHVNTTFIELEY